MDTLFEMEVIIYIHKESVAQDTQSKSEFVTFKNFSSVLRILWGKSHGNTERNLMINHNFPGEIVQMLSDCTLT